MTKQKTGIGFRKEIEPLILNQDLPIDLLEITAEHFYHKRDERVLKKLLDRYPISVHSLSLALGNPTSVIKKRLKELKKIARHTGIQIVSEHVAKTCDESSDYGHLTPVNYDQNFFEQARSNIMRMQDCLKKPIAIENITCHLDLEHEIPETDFLNSLCHETGCSLLVDVANLMINSKNHNFCPYQWIDRIKAPYVELLHMVGVGHRRGIYYDNHAENCQKPILELAQYALQSFTVQAVVLERDSNFPDKDILKRELLSLRYLTPHDQQRARLWPSSFPQSQSKGSEIHERILSNKRFSALKSQLPITTAAFGKNELQKLFDHYKKILPKSSDGLFCEAFSFNRWLQKEGLAYPSVLNDEIKSLNSISSKWLHHLF